LRSSDRTPVARHDLSLSRQCSSITRATELDQSLRTSHRSHGRWPGLRGLVAGMKDSNNTRSVQSYIMILRFCTLWPPTRDVSNHHRKTLEFLQLSAFNPCLVSIHAGRSTGSSPSPLCPCMPLFLASSSSIRCWYFSGFTSRSTSCASFESASPRNAAFCASSASCGFRSRSMGSSPSPAWPCRPLARAPSSVKW